MNTEKSINKNSTDRSSLLYLNFRMGEGAKNEQNLSGLFQGFCGSKHKNLCELKCLIHKLKLKNVRIPDFFGISHRDVNKFLEKHTPNVFTNWKKAVHFYDIKLPKQLSSHDSLTQSLTAIRQDILYAFSQASDKELHEYFPNLKLLKQKKYWSVRSSSNEDGSIANAGGNYSKNYVSPAQVKEEIGRVVASYFSVQSLQNRLNGGANPFKELPQLSVLIQETIGEPVGGAKNPEDIPRAAVVFSDVAGDPETQVMRVSATLGSCAALVDNVGIQSDTFYFVRHKNQKNPKKQEWVGKRQKPCRLAPLKDRKIQLRSVKNTPELACQCSLDDKMIQRIFDLTVALEKEREHSIDMELVIKRKMINLVQIRPFNLPKKKQDPCYIDLDKLEKEKDQPYSIGVNSKVLLFGSSAVKTIFSPKEVLVRDTLDLADRAYDRDKHRLVVVYRDEDSNTHPRVNFTPRGVPCLFVKDKEQFEMLMEEFADSHKKRSEKEHSNPQMLAVCSQRGDLYLWNSKKTPLKKFISPGWGVFPYEFSRFANFTDPLLPSVSSTCSKELRRLVLKFHTAKNNRTALEALKKLSQLVNKGFLKFNRLKKMVQGNEKSIKQVIDAVEQLETALKTTIQDLNEALKKNDSSLSTAFSRRKLHYLLMDTSRDINGDPSLSLVSLTPHLEALQEIVVYQDKSKGQLAEEAALGVMVPYCQKAWTQFLIGCDAVKSKEKINRLKNLIHQIKTAGVFPLWLLTSFEQHQKLPPEKIVDELLKGYTEETAQTLKSLVAHKQRLANARVFLSGLDAPRKAFLQGWRGVCGGLGSLAFSVPLANSKKHPSFIQELNCQVMDQAITLVDDAVKIVKASSKLSTEEKKKYMRPMLETMLIMFIKWTEKDQEFKDLAKREIVHECEDESEDYKILPWDQYIEKLKKILNQKNLDLEANPEFDARESVFGHFLGEDYWCYQDLYSFDALHTVLHQNLFRVLVLKKPSRLPIPLAYQRRFNSMFEAFKNEFQKRIEWDGKLSMKLLKSDVRNNRVHLSYHVPLKIHYGRLNFIYDLKTGRVQVEAGFFTLEDYECKEFTEYLQMLNDMRAFPNKVEQDKTGLYSKTTVSLPKHMKRIATIFRSLYFLTFLDKTETEKWVDGQIIKLLFRNPHKQKQVQQQVRTRFYSAIGFEDARFVQLEKFGMDELLSMFNRKQFKEQRAAEMALNMVSKVFSCLTQEQKKKVAACVVPFIADRVKKGQFESVETSSGLLKACFESVSEQRKPIDDLLHLAICSALKTESPFRNTGFGYHEELFLLGVLNAFPEQKKQIVDFLVPDLLNPKKSPLDLKEKLRLAGEIVTGQFFPKKFSKEEGEKMLKSGTDFVLDQMKKMNVENGSCPREGVQIMLRVIERAFLASSQKEKEKISKDAIPFILNQLKNDPECSKEKIELLNSILLKIRKDTQLIVPFILQLLKEKDLKFTNITERLVQLVKFYGSKEDKKLVC